ncbi:MAG: pimeloyl-ACP methyl ester esterase BioH [Burkholderiales bacterium]|nr:pimeloyl-ACP methyl ester esterase BioH [Burkholderiales bacterium]
MTLNCVESGSGPDLVLVHGWGMHAGIWDGLARELSAQFRVHAVDLPGYGESATCDPCTLEHMASLLARQMPQRSLVCGWSLGGLVALTWAALAPRQVARLALIATTPCFTQRVGWPHAIAADVLHDFAEGLRTDYAATLKRFLSLQALGDAQARQVAQRLKVSLLARAAPDPVALGQGLEILLNADLRDRLGAIGQPVLVVHGDRDLLTPLAAGEYLSRNLPNAQLVRLHGAAHAPFVSNVQGTGALLKRFFDE